MRSFGAMVSHPYIFRDTVSQFVENCDKYRYPAMDGMPPALTI